MEAGEIGWLPTAWGPSIRVCDGVKTATKLFDQNLTYPDSSAPGITHAPVDGEILIGPYYVSYPTLTDWNVFIGYGGKWWFTSVVWLNDSGFSGGVPGEIAVIPNDHLSTGLPAILIHDSGTGHWWCPEGWVQN